jgi:hypothetical protein
VLALSGLWDSIQRVLIPFIEENTGPLTAKEAEFVRAAELSGLARHMAPYRWQCVGRPPHSRRSLALAFLAKAVWNLPTTRALLDLLLSCPSLRRLCGWGPASDVPSEATFSRVFALFARDGLPGRVHGAMVAAAMDGRIIGHVSIDSTEIDGRERAERKPRRAKPKERQKPGPKKGQKRGARLPKRLELQAGRRLEENLRDLPGSCDRGVKRGSRGFNRSWDGYKLHMAVADGGVPVAAVLTSASVHDSQVAIPLMQMGAERATSLYDLADSAYDAALVRDYSRSLGHVPLIEASGRGSKDPPMDPAGRARFGGRTTVERVFSDVKDNHGGRFVRVRGAAKVMAHLMFGVVALTAASLARLLE